MRMTIAEFRKNTREALDAVERGEEVFITRHNKTFAIIKAPFNYLTTDGKSYNIRPEIQLPDGSHVIRIEHTPKGDNPFYKNIAGATPLNKKKGTK